MAYRGLFIGIEPLRRCSSHCAAAASSLQSLFGSSPAEPRASVCRGWTQFLALGIPAVSARVGTAVDVIDHGSNGLLAGSPAEWLDALNRLISSVD